MTLAGHLFLIPKARYRYAEYIKHPPAELDKWLSCLHLSAAANSEIKLGKQLYVAPDKGGCATCHGATGDEPVYLCIPR